MAPEPSTPQGSSAKVLIAVGLVCLGAMGLAVAAALGAGDGDSTSSTSSSTASSAPTTGTLPGDGPGPTFSEGTPVDVPLVAAGATMTGETPCPAEDGSSPRTTTFENAPPLCIDAELDYRATIRTDQGDLVLLLSPERGVQSVNNFVVLSRYHYYDGMAMNGALSRSHVQFGAAIEGSDTADPPGYRVPNEAVATVYTPGTIGFVPGTDGTSGAEFFLTTYDKSADLPVLSTFGIMLDGADTLSAMDQLGTEAGQPSGVLTIESISVEPVDLDG